MVSQNDVAKRAGVSNAVVSYVVNNGPRSTSPETREKVLKAIKELGYRKNNVARSLKTRSSNVIGLIIPDSSNAFFSEVAKGIEDEVYKHGYTLMFGNSASSIARQEKYVETFISQMVDGIIFLTTPLPEQQLSSIGQYSIPVVVIDPEMVLPDFVSGDMCIVSVDGEKGGGLVGDYFVEKGHTQLAVVAGAEQVPPATVRVEGFLNSLEKYGLEAKVIWAGDHPEDGYRAANELLKSPYPPTAIFACNDLLALGILRAAADLSIEVPSQLAVIGFDDIDIANFVFPRLSTVRQPKYEMGQVAAKHLIQSIKGQPVSEDQVDKESAWSGIITLDTELITRESA
jgi:LacI family transcriptional regulator